MSPFVKYLFILLLPLHAMSQDKNEELLAWNPVNKSFSGPAGRYVYYIGIRLALCEVCVQIFLQYRNVPARDSEYNLFYVIPMNGLLKNDRRSCS